MWDETLFRDPEVFEIDFVPDQFSHREVQMRDLAFQIRPGIKGGRPFNTVCRGLPGTGKTTSVRKLMAEVEETTKKLIPIYVNCQIDNTKFAIFSQIYRRITGSTSPPSGTSFKSVYDAIGRMALRDEVVLLITLDDANYLLHENEMNNVLYALLRSYESYPGTRIGVVVILSDLDVNLSSQIDSRVSSVFRPLEIYFPPYSEEEVRDILRERVLQGFYPGSLLDAMFDLVVTQTLKSGDLRVGIDLLKRAGLSAERQARRTIEREDICGAYEVSKYLHLAASVRTLDDEERFILKTMAMRASDPQEMNTGEIFKAIKDKCGIGYTRFYEIVRKLDAMRLINLEFREKKGRTRLITIRYEPSKVLEYLP
jgi:cell division control protein 6